MNILRELYAEIGRVKEMFPRLKGDALERAKALCHKGRKNIYFNNYEGMKDALEELREFGRKKKESD